jgi:hypothetical protein
MKLLIMQLFSNLLSFDHNTDSILNNKLHRYSFVYNMWGETESGWYARHYLVLTAAAE